MRYLKPYKIFESGVLKVIDIINQCDDILLELKDEQFNTKISSPTDWLIQVYVSTSDFEWKEVLVM